MVMFEGYFDESGDFEKDPKIFCISGYFLTSEAAKIMDEEWGRVLSEHNIPYFHMVDCAHGNGVFSDKSTEVRTEIVRKLIALIKQYTLEGFSAIAREDAFEFSEETPDVYSYCVSAGVAALKIFLDTSRAKGDIAYFFESGHKSKGHAYNQVAEELEKMSASLTFAGKQQVRLLQAADLLAWQSTKYVKDRDSQKRPPRKDFLSLMEHDHSFYHIFIKDGKKSMGIELWPLTKRSQFTTSLTVEDDGPIAFLLEEKEGIPIIPVDETVGWRVGGGRMAYVAFKDMGKKDFYLGFDEPRLFEAIAGLVGATKIFADSGQTPMMLADEILLEVQGENTVLRVKLDGGASIALRLSNEALERLKDILNEG